MASGKTVELNKFDDMMFWRKPEPREKVARDRTLQGKKRIKARKRQNKINKVLAKVLAKHDNIG